MSITCKELHRLNGSPSIGVLDAQGSVIYDRYVDAEEWDNDPKAVIAKIADYLANLPAPPIATDAKSTIPLSMTDHEIETKLAEVKAADAATADEAETP